MKNSMYFALGAISLISAVSCSNQVERVPAQAVSFISSDLLGSTKNIKEQLSVDYLSIDVCTEEIVDSFKFLSQIPSDHFKSNYTKEQYGQVIKDIWSIKQSLRKHVQNWSAQGAMSKDCNSSIKAALRAARYVEDNASLYYINSDSKKLTGLEADDTSPNFSKPFPWVMSDQENFDFMRDLRSGDLLLWRGKSAVSASIARLGDSLTNFSHLSIVHRDPKTNKLYHMESLIETGLIYQDMQSEPFHHGTPRVVVLRHKDAALAARAGEFAYKRAKETMGTENHLYYDFGFDLKDHKKVFCSEIVNWAYHEASRGELDIPPYKTLFNMKNRSFLNAIGTDAQTGFQPGDIELTPEFDMIAEWRNFNYSRANQLKDIIHTQIYRWMDEYNYNFKWSFKGNILGTFVYGVRRIPGISGLLESKLPLNMSRKTLSAVLTMEKTSDKIYDEMKKRLFKKDPYKVYSIYDIEKELEKLRLEDLGKYKKQIEANRNGEAYPNPKFHHLLGPDKKDI